MSLRLLVVALLLGTGSHVAVAQTISLNFSENSDNQVFGEFGQAFIGPLMTDSATWNNTADFASPASGALTDLIDQSGAPTSADVTWSSANTWFTKGGTLDDEHRLGVGYLDDGGNGVSITVTDIPYSHYTVYGLLASDQSLGDPIDTYNTVDFVVNGNPVFGGTAPAYNSVDDSLAATGSFWSLADGVNIGNYWTITTSGSTLTIQGNPRTGDDRGSLAGIIIQEVVPEPTTALMAFALLGGIVAMRFRR
jgi:hypothetical protein